MIIRNSIRETISWQDGHGHVSFLSDEGDDLDAGERAVGRTTSDSLDFEGGEDDLLPSTCIRSSRSRSLAAFGDDADVGESVAIGGSIGTEL